MRTQNKPFVVEIKKTKRTDKISEPAAQVSNPVRWGEDVRNAAPDLSPSDARKAAEALFDFKPIQRSESTEAQDAEPAPQRRVLWAQPVAPAPAADESELADEADRPRRRGRPKGSKNAVVQVAPEFAANAVEKAETAKPRIKAPATSRVTRPAQPKSYPPTRLEPVMTVPLSPQPAASAALAQLVSFAPRNRRGAEALDDLPRGQRWKRRLPKVCR